MARVKRSVHSKKSRRKILAKAEAVEARQAESQPAASQPAAPQQAATVPEAPAAPDNGVV